MARPIRRVVTGLDGQGRSAFISDGQTPCQFDATAIGVAGGLLWETNQMPASNLGNADAADRSFPKRIAPENGTAFYVFEYAPGAGRAAPRDDGTKEPGSGMHSTATIDYIVVISGEMTLLTQTGETVLRAGDTVVDRGVKHAWENRGSEPVVMASITIDAHPLGEVDLA